MFCSTNERHTCWLRKFALQNFHTESPSDETRRHLENTLCIVRKSEFSVMELVRVRYSYNNEPVMNELLARSASFSWPNGVRNGDFEFRVAAMVRAGSRQRKMVAMSRNLPIWMSVGRALSRRPRGVISSLSVSARTCNSRIQVMSVQ